MTNEQPLFSLEGADLSNLLMPSWVKEDASKTSNNSYQEKRSDSASTRFDRAPYNEKSRGDRRAPRSGSSQEHRGGKNRRDSAFQKKEISPRRVVAPVVPKIEGWDMGFFPEQRGLDEIAKQIKAEAKAYPLFELARLVLEKPERYRIQFSKLGASSSKVYQALTDGSLWLNEKEAVAHLFKTNRDRYYSSEKITIESPKGSYSSVAVCGQTILGPSNHHEYQAKVRQLHAESFPNLPFEVFKSRIQMVRDEATIEKWKEEQTVREVFATLNTAEGSEPEKFTTLADVEEHFKKQYATALVAEISDELILSGAVMKTSSHLITDVAQEALDQLRDFPLPLSHLLGQEFTTRGLQIFKARKNIVYVSVARPRVLNRTETPVSTNLIALLDTLETHAKSPRPEQWKALVASRPLLEEETEAERESAVAKDLSWLIHEGYVINYALRGFEVTKNAKVEEPKKSLE